MSGTIDSRVRRSGNALVELIALAAMGATCCVACLEYFPKAQPGESQRAIAYESQEVRQLAQSALKKYERSIRLDGEIYKMDKNHDRLITEEEVIAYVRGK